MQHPYVRDLYASDCKVAVYNKTWEVQMLDFDPIDRERLIELMPFDYCPKEKYVKMSPLSHRSSKFLPAWNEENLEKWAFHNFSCLVKEFLLYITQDSITPDVRFRYEKSLYNPIKPGDDEIKIRRN